MESIQNYETRRMMSCATSSTLINNHMFVLFLFELFVCLAENLRMH